MKPSLEYKVGAKLLVVADHMASLIASMHADNRLPKLWRESCELALLQWHEAKKEAVKTIPGHTALAERLGSMFKDGAQLARDIERDKFSL